MEQSQTENTELIETKRPLVLVILDGWGFSPQSKGNAIALAHTPNYNEILKSYPNTTLTAAGVRVGLSQDEPGSSEAGHLSIGSGRVFQTDVSQISSALDSGEFSKNEVLKEAFRHAKERNCGVHFIGLLSEGGVHSSSRYLYELLSMAKTEGVDKLFIHAILDGKNVEQRTADTYVEVLQIKLAEIGRGEIATLCGRYYAMDRDENLERTARAVNLLLNSEGEASNDAVNAIRGSFLRGIADEFIQPIVLEREPGVPIASVKENDLIVYFNHRGDRMRQIVKAISIDGKNGQPNVETVCLTEYDKVFDLPIAFKNERAKNILAELFAKNHLTNCRISEADRVANVRFFNGGIECEFDYEERVLIPSQKNSQTEVNPELNCFKVTNAFLRCSETIDADVFIVNLAAADMVAESGSIEKVVESIQFIDTCVGGILEEVREMNGVAVFTSSHGNCEEMINLLTGEPHNLPTGNKVPFILVDENAIGTELTNNGSLEDVAPTILGILGIEIPGEMTGSDLRIFES